MSRLTRHTALSACILALACAAGCSGGGKSAVSGNVKLDGQPLKEGLIKLVPADNKPGTMDAAIRDGKYTLTAVPPGEYRVEISANKVVGKKKMYDTPDSPTVDEVVELLPARYNTGTELKLTVKSGSQEKDFELAGK